MSAPTIADAWGGPRNNFNLMRLVAAWLVIYGHAHAITGIPGNDGIASVTGFRAAGAVAVDMFFVLSGFLIAASLARNSVRGYLASRALRILPALLACVALTTFVVGPLLTTDPGYNLALLLRGSLNNAVSPERIRETVRAAGRLLEDVA